MSAPVDDPGWGPAVQGGRGGRGRMRRLGRWLLLLVIVVPLVVVLAAGAYALTQLERVDVDGLAAAGSPLNVLVVGSDSREGLSAEERNELSTGSAPGARTDTIFVMSVQGTDAALLAFPRDLYVTRCDGSEGRINAAFQIGGASCLVQTVGQASGIPIHGFMTVSFGGFRDIVEAVGGVRMCLDRPIDDDDAGIDLPEGCQTLSGAEALGFVRVRKIDNDLQRIKRQQRFLGALADRVLSPATLLNPLQLFPTVGATAEALTINQGMGPIDLSRLALGMRGLVGGDAVTRTVPTEPATVGGAAVLVEVEGEAEALYAAYRDGSIFAQSGGDLAREDVSITVLNGTDVPGLAGRTAEMLETAGYEVATVGNAAPVDTTVIRYPTGQRARAELVAQDAPGQVEIVESADVDGVTLVLGTDAVG